MHNKRWQRGNITGIPIRMKRLMKLGGGRFIVCKILMLIEIGILEKGLWDHLNGMLIQRGMMISLILEMSLLIKIPLIGQINF